MSLFRDSESYIYDCLNRLKLLESKHEIEYRFYENDSVDSTKQILSTWLSSRNGKLLSESLGRPKFGTMVSSDRFKYMAEYRNKLLEFSKPIESDYCFLLDSDVIFDESIIDDYLVYMNENVAMLTSNTVQYELPCVMYNTSLPSYYDSLALFDLEGNNCMTWSSNPFYREEDVSKWDRYEPVSVLRAFAGAALIKSDILNKVRWYSDGDLEHWYFCDEVKKHGDILAIPTIKTRVVIDRSLVNSIPKEHINRVKMFQEKRLHDINNTKL